MRKTLGGDRLGSGKKMTVDLHGYERSTHDLSYVWRSSMAAGTLVPFMTEVALPGDTFDIDLQAEIMTHPTIGPLFGSYKVQLDVFLAPIRLYNGMLHNNMLGIGMNMSQVKLPQINYPCAWTTGDKITNWNTAQINPSALPKYLGVSGIGKIAEGNGGSVRKFNAVPLLAYWEIYKNYYANKQEEIGAVIHTTIPAVNKTVSAISVIDQYTGTDVAIDQAPAVTGANALAGTPIQITYSGAVPALSTITLNTYELGNTSVEGLATGWTNSGTAWVGTLNRNITIKNWDYLSNSDVANIKPTVTTFPLSNIDEMRKQLLAFNTPNVPFVIGDDSSLEPYVWLTTMQGINRATILNSQEGLGLKTYQSDLFNNWLSTEWIDGVNGISEITAISTTGDKFTVDALLLARKVYDMLNRIAVSGGTYDDWLDAVYTHDRYTRCESPMYMGGLSKELIFQEVVSNSQTSDQPLGTLAGRGRLSGKHKGGKITIKVDEPSYIMGIISLTPRVDYSQGNKWDTHLETMDDLHKPALDEIGFQDLITEQMAYWDTEYDAVNDKWITKSAGKQPAWINYMTNVNKTYGNFAIDTNEMFMTLNRRYEMGETGIKDLTTYIDPSKFNGIFAETAIDAQNFWAQIGVNITARRKMSAKVMPNL